MVSRSTTLAALFALTVFSASCELLPFEPRTGNGGGQQSQSIDASGTIVQIQTNGGPIFWGIQAADGSRYEPLNLPAAFAENGLKVRFTGELRFVGTPSAGWGQTIFLTSIAKD